MALTLLAVLPVSHDLSMGSLAKNSPPPLRGYHVPLTEEIDSEAKQLVVAEWDLNPEPEPFTPALNTSILQPYLSPPLPLWGSNAQEEPEPRYRGQQSR